MYVCMYVRAYIINCKKEERKTNRLIKNSWNLIKETKLLVIPNVQLLRLKVGCEIFFLNSWFGQSQAVIYDHFGGINCIRLINDWFDKQSITASCTIVKETIKGKSLYSPVNSSFVHSSSYLLFPSPFCRLFLLRSQRFPVQPNFELLFQEILLRVANFKIAHDTSTWKKKLETEKLTRVRYSSIASAFFR